MRRILASVTVVVLLLAAVATGAGAQQSVSGLRVTRVERHKLVMTWDRVPDGPTYEIVQDGSVVGTSMTNWFVATDLASETSYEFEVRASDGSVSDASTFKTGPAKRREWPNALRNISWWRGAHRVTFLGLTEPTEIRRDGVVVAAAATGSFLDGGLLAETTYNYELRLVSGVAADDRFTRTESIETVSVLPRVTGVEATLVEPGVVQLSWDALDDPSLRAYWVYVNGRRITPDWFVNRRATTRRVEITKGQTSRIYVAGFNGGGGPVSEAIKVTSPGGRPELHWSPAHKVMAGHDGTCLGLYRTL